MGPIPLFISSYLYGINIGHPRVQECSWPYSRAVEWGKSLPRLNKVAKAIISPHQCKCQFKPCRNVSGIKLLLNTPEPSCPRTPQHPCCCCCCRAETRKIFLPPKVHFVSPHFLLGVYSDSWNACVDTLFISCLVTLKRPGQSFAVVKLSTCVVM